MLVCIGRAPWALPSGSAVCVCGQGQGLVHCDRRARPFRSSADLNQKPTRDTREITRPRNVVIYLASVRKAFLPY